MPRVEMVQVYNLQVIWVYDGLEAALARVRKDLATMPKEATVIPDLGAMSVAEYAALPADED